MSNQEPKKPIKPIRRVEVAGRLQACQELMARLAVEILKSDYGFTNIQQVEFHQALTKQFEEERKRHGL